MTKSNPGTGIPQTIRVGSVIDLTDQLPPPPEHVERIELAEADVKNRMAFSEVDLPDPLRRAVDDLGFTHCTPIQAAALAETLKGRDLMGQAQTGTGKTATFLLTVINELLATERLHESAPRAVVIAPTRELALQIAEDSESLNRYTDLNTVAVFGGMDWDKQARALEEPVDILVGTPGRMIDYIKRGLIHLRAVQVVVIDEADRMFDMGFINDIRWLIGKCSAERQTLLFSATFPFDVVRLAQRFLKDPLEVKITPEQVAADTVEQLLYHVPHFEKLQFTLWALEENKPQRCLVFVNTKRTGEWLAFKLWHNGWEAGYISGDVAQKKRLKLVEQFKSGDLELLVATDVAARGLHVDDVDLVLNFDLPDDAPDYVHRIGRTGRAGAEGKAISIADERLVENLAAIERYLGHQIKSVVPDDDNFLTDQSPSFRETVVKKRNQDGRGGKGGRGGNRRSKPKHNAQPGAVNAGGGETGNRESASHEANAKSKKRRRKRGRGGKKRDDQGTSQPSSAPDAPQG